MAIRPLTTVGTLATRRTVAMVEVVRTVVLTAVRLGVAAVNNSPDSDTMADEFDYLKVLYYGDNSRRKTTYLAQASRHGKMLAVDTEGKWLKRPLKQHGAVLDNIVLRRATTYQEMEDIFWSVESRVDSGEIKTVVVDGLSDLEQRFVRAATMSRQTRKSGLGRVEEFRSAKALIDKGVNPFQTELGDYGTWTNQARHLMRLYRDLRCHVAFAAHQKIEMGKYVPSLTEKFRNELMASLNVVVGCDLVQLGSDDDDLFGVGVFREIDGWRGTDQAGITTKAKIVNPSLDRLILASEGKLNLAQSDEQKMFKKRLESQ